MSSQYVRNTFKNFLTANAPTEKYLDIDGEYEEIENLLNDAGIGMRSPWLGVQYVPGDETPITAPSRNNVGKYRETGVIYLHVVEVAKLGLRDAILGRGEALRNLLRGRRIDRIVIESVTPVSFASGATLQFESGFTAGSVLVSFVCDLDL